MTAPGDEDRAFAMGITHEGRRVPPDGWGLETTPGIFGKGADLPFVQVQGGALLPSLFVMQLSVPAPSRAVIRLVYDARKNGISITTIWTEGMDAVQAVDALRRIAPIEVWNRIAVRDLGWRVAMMALNAGSDGVDVLTRHGLSEENARLVLQAFSSESGTWPTFQSGDAPSVSSESPEWAAAMGSWRERLEAGDFESAVRGTPTRPTVRRNRVTKEHLTAVAAVYREAQDAGEPPTLAVAEAFQTTHSTATRWVGLARKEQLLGPAQKGKAGEVDLGEASD
jgi:hypothetical protein